MANADDDDELLNLQIDAQRMLDEVRPKPSEKSDKLFIPDADVDPWHSACLNYLHDHSAFYGDGYLKAGHVLVDHALKDSGDLDTLVYPIAFLYRQYLELRLKQIIDIALRLHDRASKPKLSHDIKSLWLAWRKLDEELYPGSTSKEQLDGIERLIDEFVAVDPTSQGFRYATDTKGNRSLAGLTLVNVRNLRDVMIKIADQLEYYYTGLYGELDAQAEAERCGQEMVPSDDYGE